MTYVQRLIQRRMWEEEQKREKIKQQSRVKVEKKKDGEVVTIEK